jgi:hypothetical protein
MQVSLAYTERIIATKHREGTADIDIKYVVK